jgi:hypothetical protein
VGRVSVCEDRHGCVYVIGSGEFVKIGFSASPRTRLASIQACCPTKVELEHLATGTMEDEQQIHYCLRSAGLKVRGEWYRREDVLGVIHHIRTDQIEEAILAAVEINRCRRWAKARGMAW